MGQNKDKAPAVKPETLELADKMYELMQGAGWWDAAQAAVISANRMSVLQTGVGLRLTVVPLIER